MNISVEKLLTKMEEELLEAKVAHSEVKIRERVHAIKTMCELILEENRETNIHKTVPTSTPTSNVVGQVGTPIQQPRMRIDDDSNGESIFDF